MEGYFDYNATTPLWPEAKAAWIETVDRLWLNPSSPYRAAARVKAHLESAREAMSALFAVAPERLAFNSGATEGNNAVFAHWARVLPADARIGVGPSEHPSVIEAAKCSFGDRIVWLRLDAAGAVDADAVDYEGLAAVSVMAANNETGVLNPWGRIARDCRKTGVRYHCDASQWVGKMPPEGLAECGVVTACAHKFGGPRGVGFWILPDAGVALSGQVGGAQEGGRRAGTPDVAGIRAMAAALRRSESLRQAASARFRDGFIDALKQTVPGAKVVGEGAERLWNTLCVILPDFASARWVRALEKRGFYVSAGSACSTGKEGPSPVLAAMGLPADEMRRAIRISSGWLTSAAEWKALCAAVGDAYEAMKREADASGSEVISI
ncbi:MAG: cysteine desulfurase family protein [Verrucomicrobiota bacterium]